MTSDADQFLIKAKQAVVDANNTSDNTPRAIARHFWVPGDLYIVWFCKVLGNWKALISTDTIDGYYWEVTYNGAKQETYVDTYVKGLNVAIPDGRI